METWRVAFSGDSERRIKKCSVNNVALCELYEGNLETGFLLGTLRLCKEGSGNGHLSP
jgi:hypothetical protein